MVFYWAHFKVVADIKLKQKITSLLCHLVNKIVLVFIQFYIRNRRQGIESHVHNILPVVHYPDWCFRRLNNTQNSCVNHFTVK